MSKFYAAKYRDRSDRIQLRKIDGRDAVDIILLLVDDISVAEFLSVRPFDDFAFSEMLVACNT